MSGEASSARPQRKICVPRRRCSRDKGLSATPNPTALQSAKPPSTVPPAPPTIPAAPLPSLPNNTTGPLSFNFAPVSKTDTDKKNVLGAVGGCDFTAAVLGQQQQQASVTQETASSGGNAFDVSNAADAFSKVSLQEKSARTLYEAVRLDDTDLLNELLQDKPAIKDQLDYALTMAVTKKSPTLAEILLKNGANPKYLDHCYPLLMTAADLNDSDTVDLLLEYGADPNVGGMHGTALHSAMRFGSVSLVKKLINAGAKLESGGRLSSLITIGMKANNLECLDLILDKCSSVDDVDGEDSTPLHLAARLGKTDITNRLLARGVNPMKPDKDGALPWMLAVKNKHKKDADILFPSQDKINCQIGEKLKTPLHYACSTGMPRCVSRLVQEGANVNIQDIDGSTPAMDAIRNGHVETAMLILKLSKVDLELADKNHNTTLFTALRYIHSDTVVADALHKAGSDVNKRLPNNRTILMDSVSVPDVAEWLLDAGADPAVCSEYGETAIGNAVDWGAKKSVRLLLEANIPLEQLCLPGPKGISPIEKAINSNDKIMKMLVHAGCSVNFLSKWLRSENSQALRAAKPMRIIWLEQHLKQLPTLMELTRHAIVKSLGSQDMGKKVEALALPSKLNFLFHLDTFTEWKKKQYHLDEEEEDEEEEDQEEEDSDEWVDDDEDSDEFDEDGLEDHDDA